VCKQLGISRVVLSSMELVVAEIETSRNVDITCISGIFHVLGLCTSGKLHTCKNSSLKNGSTSYHKRIRDYLLL
jgi:hypothetical protein